MNKNDAVKAKVSNLHFALLMNAGTLPVLFIMHFFFSIPKTTGEFFVGCISIFIAQHIFFLLKIFHRFEIELIEDKIIGPDKKYKKTEIALSEIDKSLCKEPKPWNKFLGAFQIRSENKCIFIYPAFLGFSKAKAIYSQAISKGSSNES
jgi:hypothetical protein